MRTLYRGDGQEVGAEPVLDTLATDAPGRRPARRRHRAGRQRLGGQRGDRPGPALRPAGQRHGDGRLDRRRRLRELPSAKASNATASDDPLAKGFPLARPMSVALAPDGGFYIADYLVDWGVQTAHLPRRPGGPDQHIAGCMCTGLGTAGPRCRPR